jgi:hypothetical protein
MRDGAACADLSDMQPSVGCRLGTAPQHSASPPPSLGPPASRSLDSARPASELLAALDAPAPGIARRLSHESANILPMRWVRPAASVFAIAGAVFAAFTACGESSPPGGTLAPGDHLHVDVEASDLPAQPDAGQPADSPFLSVDGPYHFGPGADAYAYAPLGVCSKCACEAGTYCFGGGTGHTTFSGTCNHTGSSGGLDVGCEPLPAACASKPDCNCLIQTVGASITCYSECTGTKSLTLYCPVP